MGNISGKFAEKIATHTLCSKTLYENYTIYKKMQKNSVQLERLHDIAHALYMLDN